MSKQDSGKGGFEVLALSNAKGKTEKKKGGSLNDLFKCIESLASSTEELNSYASSGIDPADMSEIERYLNGIGRIQDGLLEMAQKRVRSLSKIPSINDGIDLSEGKIIKE